MRLSARRGGVVQDGSSTHKPLMRFTPPRRALSEGGHHGQYTKEGLGSKGGGGTHRRRMAALVTPWMLS